MTGNAKIGAALVGGYLLGRTRKAKAAIGLGMFLAGRKMSLDPQQIARKLADSPALSGLGDQARREIVDATKSAAATALTKRADHLADALHERTLRLGGAGDESRAEPDGEPANGDPEDGEMPSGESRREDSEPASGSASGRTRKPVEKAGGRAAKKVTGAGRSRQKARAGGRGGDDG